MSEQDQENLENQNPEQGSGETTPPQSLDTHDPNAETDNADAGGEKPKTRRGRGKNKDSIAPDGTEPSFELCTPIGTVKVENGKEMVNVGPDTWVLVIRPADKPLADADSGTRVQVKNASLKGQKILTSNGKIAEFNESGIAEVARHEAEYLLKIPGYEKV